MVLLEASQMLYIVARVLCAQQLAYLDSIICCLRSPLPSVFQTHRLSFISSNVLHSFIPARLCIRCSHFLEEISGVLPQTSPYIHHELV